MAARRCRAPSTFAIRALSWNPGLALFLNLASVCNSNRPLASSTCPRCSTVLVLTHISQTERILLCTTCLFPLDDAILPLYIVATPSTPTASSTPVPIAADVVHAHVSAQIAGRFRLLPLAWQEGLGSAPPADTTLALICTDEHTYALLVLLPGGRAALMDPRGPAAASSELADRVRQCVESSWCNADVFFSQPTRTPHLPANSSSITAAGVVIVYIARLLRTPPPAPLSAITASAPSDTELRAAEAALEERLAL